MILIISLLSLFAVTSLADNQAVAVRGTLMCGDAPLTQATVKLYEDDTGPDLDDLMAEGTTDSAGNFYLQGVESELLKIDPKLNIYHDCNDGIKPCQRRVTIFIPAEYIATGSVAQRTFNLGTVNMEAEFEGESRDCLHRH